VVSIHHQELVAVVYYVALNGLLQGVEARKNVCFLMEEAFIRNTRACYLVISFELNLLLGNLKGK